MGRYSDLTDEELQAKIVTFRDAIETVSIGGDVAVVAGEGRRMEFTKGNLSSAERILEQLELEWASRYPGTPGQYGRAIGMRFPR